MIRNTVGLPVRGEDFFDREELIQELWNRLEAGNILLAAPRRFGKTSLMYHLLDNPKPRWNPIHIDAESIIEPINFIIALLDALMADRKIRKFLSSALKKTYNWTAKILDDLEVGLPYDFKVKIKLKDILKQNWKDYGEKLLSMLGKYDKNEKLLIIIDELPVMLYLFRDNGLSDKDTRAFLYWFRKLRTDPRIGLTNCRFLIGGSIGIENFLSQIKATDSFNDFERRTIPELGKDCAIDLLKKLGESHKLKLSPLARKKILELIGIPFPYFIQIFVSELSNELANHPNRINPKFLEKLYEERILGTWCKSYFHSYYERLCRYEKTQEVAAKALLKELALAFPNGISIDKLKVMYDESVGSIVPIETFNQLLNNLENDFYIKYSKEDNGYIFASKILCDWWRRYYAF